MIDENGYLQLSMETPKGTDSLEWKDPQTAPHTYLSGVVKSPTRKFDLRGVLVDVNALHKMTVEASQLMFSR